MSENTETEVKRPTLEVDAEDLYRLLQAVNGPGHYIRELQVTLSISELEGTRHPIIELTKQFNAWATEHRAANNAEKTNDQTS